MKSKIKINRIMFPKNTYKTNAGDFAIFTATIEKHLEGDAPILHQTYGTITLKGNVPAIKMGQEFIAVYDNPDTNKFGTSYDLKMLTKEVDKTNEKQVREYLKILCGEVIANELMQLPDPIGLIERRESEELLKVKGIGNKKLESIYRGMAETCDFTVAFAELCPLGLTKNLVKRICQAYGSPETAIELCKTNPYELVKKVSGVSFLVADEIGKKCGLDMQSSARIECLIYHVLNEQGSSGKSYLTSNQLLTMLYDSLEDVSFEKLDKCILKMQEDNTIMLLNNGGEIALTYYFELEKAIALEINRIKEAESKIEIPTNWMGIVSDLEEEQGWKHTDEQIEGIKTTLENNLIVITGKAGSGKSTITNAMCKVLSDYVIKITCLSAKASERIGNITGLESSTIHRLLGLNRQKINPNEIMPIMADVIIIDESSMVNGELFLATLKAIRSGSKLIILGDDGQLQAIGDCAVFSDLLRAKNLPIIRLTKIHRQAQASAIITKSIDIRNQQELYPKNFEGHMVLGELHDLELFIQKEKEGLDLLVVQQFFKELEKNNFNILEVQIITAMKNRGSLSANNINNMIQKAYNSNYASANKRQYITNREVLILEDDKVINTKNNYNTKDINGEKTPTFNGNIGIVTKITDEKIIVDFNDKIIEFEGKARDSLSLAYAITVHSSQGSQWDSVISTFDSSMWILLNVEILYTAITRASKHAIVIAEDKAIQHAIKTVEQNTKQTYLGKFLYYM